MFGVVGNVVGCRDGTAHVDGLPEHHRYPKHVAVVGVEGINHFLSETVEHADGGLSEIGAHLLHDGTHLLGLLYGHESLLYQTADVGAHIGGGACHRGADVAEGGLLVVAENRNLLAHVFVATEGTHLGQVFGAQGLAGVERHFLFQFGRAHLLVVAQCH